MSETGACAVGEHHETGGGTAGEHCETDAGSEHRERTVTPASRLLPCTTPKLLRNTADVWSNLRTGTGTQFSYFLYKNKHVTCAHADFAFQAVGITPPFALKLAFRSERWGSYESGVTSDHIYGEKNPFSYQCFAYSPSDRFPIFAFVLLSIQDSLEIRIPRDSSVKQGIPSLLPPMSIIT